MNRLITILLTLTLAAPLYGQQKNIREAVYLQVNSDDFITGETLYFSAFVTSAASSKLSDLSSILYVELIGEDRVVFQQKILLENGRGSGEFFMPSLVSTGTYQLIAYTKWMKNFDTYFQKKITIVNPFEEYQIPEKQGLSATFYPESGSLINGQENQVAFHITKERSGVVLKGKVVNDAGDKIADIASDSSGLGTFKITPRAGQAYQAILEDEFGDFHFFNLPATRVDQSIHVEESPGYFSITVHSAEHKLVRLSVADGQNLIYNEEVETNHSVRLYKKNLIPGAYIASAGNSERVFVYQKEQSEVPQKKNVFQPRELVQIPIAVSAKTSASITVRKKNNPRGNNILTNRIENNLTKPLFETSDIGFTATWSGAKMIESQDSVNYLPEVRGELITGQLIGPSDDITHATIAFSTIGEHYQLRVAQPGADGHFVIQIDPIVGDHPAYLALLDVDSTVSLQMDDPFLEEYPPFSYDPVSIDSATAIALAERSVRNQIQNAYYQFDSRDEAIDNQRSQQFGRYSRLYVLDEYNRFPKMHEHFIEFIPEVVARQNSTRSKLKVLSRFLLPYDLDPLILVDGVPTTADRILNFSPYKIKSIGVINNRIFIGPLIADGLVSFHTFQGDLHTFNPGVNGLKFTHQGVEYQQDHTFPSYHDSAEKLNERIPDFRDQLYWNPLVELSPEQPYMLEFYTSDTEGPFEVIVEGFSTDGEPFLFEQLIQVNPPVSN